MQTDLFKTVEEFKKHAHALGFNKGYKHYAKYHTLYTSIRKRKPQFVLECGSGVTTLVILLALKENEEGRLISMDEDSFFGGTVKKIVDHMFPGAPLDMHIVPAVSDVYSGIIGTRYEHLPDYQYDFVFVDGPQTDGVDLDVFPLLAQNPRLSVLIDVRFSTVMALKKLYPQAYFSHVTNLGYVNL